MTSDELRTSTENFEMSKMESISQLSSSLIWENVACSTQVHHLMEMEA